MTPRRRWSREEDARLRELMAGGLQYPAIAEAMGRTRASVERRVARLGQRKGRSPGIPADFADRCAELHYSALCRHYGKIGKTITRWLRWTGLTPAAYVPAPPPPRRFNYAGPKVTQIQRDYSPEAQAADHLRRYTFVYRCTERGRADHRGEFYRYGDAVLTPDELIRRAEAKGWRLAA